LQFHRIVAAVDNSETSRQAARIAALIASRVGAELTVLTVSPESPGSKKPASGQDRPLDLLNPDILAALANTPIKTAVAHGLPQVEVGRFAESIHADLLVLGRKARSRATRLFLGDTADAVIRRSRLPCLLVPTDLSKVERIGAALDGSDRGFVVYQFAERLASGLGLELTSITVEPAWPGEPDALACSIRSTRSERLAQMMEDSAVRLNDGRRKVATTIPDLKVRRGEIVECLINTVNEQNLDILVTGFHRGGPPVVIDTNSVCRQLVHGVPCATLTVPL
jgi:nucleotide-binding universal stress UspA family protein